MMHNNFSMASIVKDIVLFKGYTFMEKMNFIQGMPFSLNHLWNDVLAVNLFETSTSFQVPVYITHGKYDYQVSYALAREYFEAIDAPKKAFFTFENSAHSPNAEEPEQFVQIVRNIMLENN